MASRIAKRRGVVLLVVLSLLVLFILLTLTFAIAAGNFRRAAEATARTNETGDPPARLLEGAFYQVLRGPADKKSPLWGHDLLRDLYGDDGVTGQVNRTVLPAISASGEFISLNYDPTPLYGQFVDSGGYYAGCVFTLLEGPLAGYSTRVVFYDPTNASLWIEMFSTDSAALTTNIATQRAALTAGFISGFGSANARGYRFQINGKPFNGAGYGYTFDSMDLSYNGDPSGSTNSPIRYALNPNYSEYLPAASSLPFGGADESWDVWDYQNLFLARIGPGGGSAIPSFHRPSLINYWANRGAIDARSNFISPAELLKRICLRPLPLPGQHPNFTGSNAAAGFAAGNTGTRAELINLVSSLVNGPWDVDNDGNGVPDSIWLDLKFPTNRAPDGRLYRPLFAILCQDMDGRVNVNAVGNQWQTTTSFSTDALASSHLADRPATLTRVRGAGYGPAEIYDSGLDSFITARYGSNSMPGFTGDDVLSRLKSMGRPSNHFGGVISNYGTAPDVWGRGELALDHRGQPLTAHMGTAQTVGVRQYNETVDDPYEINLVDANGADLPFSTLDLERLLRVADIDRPSIGADSQTSQAGSRLVSLQGSKDIVTSHSSHIPAPRIRLPDELAGRVNSWTVFLNQTEAQFQANASSVPWYVPNWRPWYFFLSRIRTGTVSITDIYTLRLFFGHLDTNSIAVPAPPATSPSGDPPTQTFVSTQLQRMLPFEFVHGQKMDVNRAWGNGEENGGAATTPDDYVELAAGETVFQGTPLQTQAQYANDYPGASSEHGRIIYARHLFCLAMALMDPDHLESDLAASSLPADQKRELTVKRLAQWAVNAVDFRDPDGIMTAFEYDVDPFNGWNSDGDLRTDEANDMVDNDGDGDVDEPDERERRVVFGAEQPDLLLTEATAFHDRRVKDTDLEQENTDLNSPVDPMVVGPRGKKRLDFPGRGRGVGVGRNGRFATGDADVDQYRVPQGSLFVELYCPRTHFDANPSVPQELYTVLPVQGQSRAFLDLGRMAPAAAGTASQPVWRLALSSGRLSSRPAETTSHQPDDLNSVTWGSSAVASARIGTASSDPVDLERFIWFASTRPAASVPGRANIYFNRRDNSANTRPSLLETGGYAVVGPRAQTIVGSRRNPGGVAPPAPVYLPSRQQMSLNLTDTWLNIVTGSAAGFGRTDLTGGSATPASNYTNIKPILPIIAAADPPTTWTSTNTTAPTGIGISISEPVVGKYYPEPTQALGNGFPKDAYYSYSSDEGGMYDVPFDSRDQPAALWTPVANPGGGSSRQRTGTYANERAAFLQRLANPLTPWNPFPGQTGHNPNLDVNPYITVDRMNIDLTVFNGEDSNSQPRDNDTPPVQQWIDTHDPDPFGSAPDELFETRARSGGGQRNLWARAFPTPNATAPQGTNEYFSVNLGESLGYLNGAFGARINASNNPLPGTPPSPRYFGDPATDGVQTFPWLTWNNRPYASQLELLNVPVSSQGRLLQEFAYATAADDPYRASGSAYSFSHLLNVFESNVHITTRDRGIGGGAAPGHLYRMLELLEVPSRFAGTERWYNNATTATYRPPFNKMSRFRDPGKVNINTIPYNLGVGSDGLPGVAGVDDDGNSITDFVDINMNGTYETGEPLDYGELGWPGSDDYSSVVWDAVVAGFPDMNSTHTTTSGTPTNFPSRVFASMRGYRPAGVALTPFLNFNNVMHPDLPTLVANPFRSPFAAHLAPDLTIRTSDGNRSLATDWLQKPGVEATLLRSNFVPSVTAAGAAAEYTRPLFVLNSSVHTGVVEAHRNQDRNSYFRYQGLQRLENLITTNSNVYAIWITVGFFEVDPATGSLGQELGLTNGRVKRHRGFYLVDRSIPVAFQPDMLDGAGNVVPTGQNHNVDRAVLLRRFIE